MEKWCKINYIENYLVSNYGNIKSLNRTIIRSNGRKQTFKERILKPINTTNGYLTANVNHSVHLIHRIVAFHFVMGYNIGYEVNHIDGNKQNNNSDNLEWVNRRENYTHGRLSVSNNLTGAVFYKSKKSKQWASRIKVNGKSVFLGFYNTDIEAHDAYNNYILNNSLKNKYSYGN